MKQVYDVVIVGGGHNGLVAAGYLSQAGLSVLVLERRSTLAGACVTEEIAPGFRCSTMSYVCSLLRPEIVRDLELVRLGGRFRRLDRTDQALLIKVMTMSIADLLDECFDSQQLKTALAAGGSVVIYGSPRTPGTAFVLLHHGLGEVGGEPGAWGFVRGGMAAISEALAASARAHGAALRTDAAVERIAVEDGMARGVILEGGEEIAARVVASNADTDRTSSTRCTMRRRARPGEERSSWARVRPAVASRPLERRFVRMAPPFPSSAMRATRPSATSSTATGRHWTTTSSYVPCSFHA